jgi:hypothetical protein
LFTKSKSTKNCRFFSQFVFNFNRILGRFSARGLQKHPTQLLRLACRLSPMLWTLGFFASGSPWCFLPHPRGKWQGALKKRKSDAPT